MNYNKYEDFLRNAKSLYNSYVTDMKEELEPFKKFVNPKWSDDRKAIALLQFYISHILNIELGDIDGLYGPLTDEAFIQSYHLLTEGSITYWRTDELNSYKKLKTKYPTYDKIRDYYGEPNTNITSMDLPYFMKLSWDTNSIIRSIQCHEKVVEPLTNILEEVRNTYSPKEIKSLGLDLYGGCFNYRKMKGGEKLSTHAWGVAIDINPLENQLRWGRDKAAFARPEYADFMNIFNKYGAFNLGEVKNYDWMHFQFVKP